jgi:hypothetical protein
MGNRKLSESERRTIKGHISILKSRLSCGATDDKAKAVELARLVTAFPQQGQDQVSADLRAETYFEALDGLPAWAVAEARRRIVAGSTPFGRPWGPGPIEFSDLVREVVKPVKQDLIDLELIDLAAPPEDMPSEESKQRVAAMVDQFKADLGAKTAATQHRAAVAGLEAKAVALGLPSNILDTIPDAPERTGSFRKAGSG